MDGLGRPNGWVMVSSHRCLSSGLKASNVTRQKARQNTLEPSKHIMSTARLTAEVTT